MKKVVLAAALALFSATVADACSPAKRGHIVMIYVNGWKNGDTCKLSDIPAPFNTLLPIRQGPGVSAFSWQYENQQYGYAYLLVDASGKGNVVFEMTNHKRFDGDTFTAAIVFRDSNQTPLHAVETRLGVNGPPFGPNKNVSTIAVTQSPEWWKRVHYLTFYHGRFQKQDDAKNWNAVYEFLKKVWEAINNSNEPPKNPQ